MSLRDQEERTRFVEELRSNISVIAPAGVGKTRAIVERIVRMANLPPDEAADRLARLVVVTYSVSAAQQMQQRARAAIRAGKLPAKVQRAFQQTFFGTIHSYCVRLLDRFGHYLGLPSPVGLLQDDAEIWQRFLLRGLGPDIAADKNARELFHFYPPDKLYALGKVISPGGKNRGIPAPPKLDFAKLLDFNDGSLHAATRRSIAKAQQAATAWLQGWEKGEGHHDLPECPTSDKARAFAEIWGDSFQPLHEWLREAAYAFGLRVANAYEKFRLSEAMMSYDDQVRLALRVLELPSVQSELAEERLSVLLDEAQDTDRRQFEVLRRVAGLGDDAEQPADQSFSIVGDFQQAIYAPRSDLRMYQAVHDKITTGPRGLKSKLQVTFRCDEAIIEFVNRVFPLVLTGEVGQSKFEPLHARDDAGAGQVVRWTCPVLTEEEGGKINAEMRSEFEVAFLAQQLKKLGPRGLGVSGWQEVAILCPRRAWLYDLKRALLDEDLPAQLHSSNEKRNDRLTGSWFTALVWIAAHPEDDYEIAGVLREIFGLPDSDMAEFTHGEGERLRLCGKAPTGEGSVAEALRTLHGVVKDASRRPLAQAVGLLVEKTRLRERLALLAHDEVEDTYRELDELLALAATRAAERKTLVEFAEELHAGLVQNHPGEEEILPAIQLLTSYKAKGLEWPVVIAPFMFRNIESASPSYPRVDPDADGGEIVSRDGDDFARQIGVLVKERERQQLQRLLYVTMTRARRTLIFVDDEEHYAAKKRKVGWPSSELLGFHEGPNREAWEALPAELTALPKAAAPEEAARKIEVSLPRLNAGDLADAVTRAGDFSRRTTPHSLAVHPRADAEPEESSEAEDDNVGQVNASGPGVRYGTWWHELAESIPWAEPPETWEKKFEEAHAVCPQPARGAKEWKLFRQSTLAADLARPGQLVQVEMPFLWRAPDGSCLEGVMDLAMREGEGKWHVIDWKTNRVEPGRDEAIADIYRAQVRAYMEVLRGMLPGDVRGSLYLTQTGKMLPID